MSGCSAERLEPGHLVLAGRRHDVHSGPVSCHCRDRGQGDQRHLLTGVQQGPRLPASEHAPGGLACRFLVRDAIGPGKRSAAGTAGGRPLAWDGCAVIADPARSAGRPGPARPTGRCACCSDRREAAAYVDSGPWRCVPQPSQRPVPTAAELRRLAMEPDQLAGEQCLNAEGLVHEHPPISGGRPASRPRCATGAHCDIRLIEPEEAAVVP